MCRATICCVVGSHPIHHDLNEELSQYATVTQNQPKNSKHFTLYLR